MRFNFLLPSPHLSGNFDTNTVVINDLNSPVEIKVAPNQSVVYSVTDACNNTFGNAQLYGPAGISGNYTTKTCGATDGNHKGNLHVYVYGNSTSDPLKYTLISGPQQLFSDTTISSSTLSLNNIDTGTYVFRVSEVNDCSRSTMITTRVLPRIDSIGYTFIPGCLNANKLVLRYYSNVNNHVNNNLLEMNASITLVDQNGNIRYVTTSDTQFNIASNKNYTVNYSCNKQLVIKSPDYKAPKITAFASFSCSSGFTIAIHGKDGVAPYLYEILSGSPVNYQAPLQSSNVFSNLPNVSGNVYQVRLRDQCGNAFTTLIKTDSINNPIITSEMPCLGNSYTATVDSIAGTHYQWTGPNGFVQQGRTLSFSTITASDTGLYYLNIYNNITGCSSTMVHSVDVRSCILGMMETHTDLACYGATNGNINITAYGGVKPYTFAWSNGATTKDLVGVPAGNYRVIITDAVQEKDTLDIVLSQPDSLTFGLATVNVSCAGSSDGSIELTMSGGAAPYSYAWSNNTYQKDIQNLVADTYTVTVTDSNLCSKTHSIVITQPDTLKLSATITDVTCFGTTNGAIDLNVVGGTGPYSFYWNDGNTDEDRTQLGYGAYSVQVTDANGCSQSLSGLMVTQPAALTFNAQVNDVNCINKNDGSIQLTVQGGHSPYTYSWSNGAQIKDIANLVPGNYTIQITDNKLCTLDSTFAIGIQNCSPVALNDHFAININETLQGSVVNNDTCGNEPCHYSKTSVIPANGALIFNPDGTFIYTPSTDYVGTDSFTYSVCDVDGDCDTATVFIVISTPLPLDFLYFDAQAGSNCKVNLAWKVASNMPVKTYNIEHSFDGRSFEIVSKVSAQALKFDYRYAYDQANEGANYFRIKAVSVDGSSIYSQTIKVNIVCDKDRNINVYPSPTQDFVNVEGLKIGETIRVMDISGRQITQLKATRSTEQIDLSLFAAGTYNFVIFTEQGHRLTFKVVKQ